MKGGRVQGAGLSDLDEFVLKCRNHGAREYISEAVSCYKAGAYRACIVSTWCAVVYDYLGKLRDLNLAGDANARVQLEEFEKHRANHDIRSLQNFEKGILVAARDDFGFLSQVEFQDLSRLLDDRNRCAHPSMQSTDDIYIPPAELARYHLYSAIKHMLIQPPVQGKAALDQIWNRVRSPYFPTNIDDAIRSLSGGPLAHARPVLIRSVVIGLTKSLIVDTHTSDEQGRKVAALAAVHAMYRNDCESIFIANLEGICTRLEDECLPNLLEFLRNFAFTWNFLSDATRIRLLNYIARVSGDALVPAISGALQIRDLIEAGRERLSAVDSRGLATLMEETKDPAVFDRAVELFCDAGSYQNARVRANRLIAPFIPDFSLAQVGKLLEAFVSNRQIKYAIGMVEIYRSIFESFVDQFEEIASEWEGFYEVLVSDKEIEHDDDLARALKDRIGHG